MNKIQLINEENQAQTNEQENMESMKDSKLNQHRPSQLSVSKIISENQKWRECKIIGKNVSIRSYSASCAFQGKFYIYGGYQILKGMMDDFYYIDLHDKVKKFDWIQIQNKGQVPGARSKHALIGAKTHIYLVAGLCTDIASSNQIFCYDPQRKLWQLIKPVGQILPNIDSFGCVYLQHQGNQKIIIIGGYDSNKAEYLNSVYQYNITKNKISILYAGSQQCSEGLPLPRSGCAAATDGKKVYMFGGKNADDRMNDIWQFNLTDFKYKQLPKAGDVPPKRNGHTMNYFAGKLYTFGGIHDITWELDDLIVYNIQKEKWVTLQQDSPRKVEKKPSPSKSVQKAEKKSPKKKNWYQTGNSFNGSKDRSFSPSRINNTLYQDQQNPSNQGRMIEQQKRKAFLQKKTNMLKNFQVQKSEIKRYLALQPQSQAIRNSLDVIGNPDPKNKIPQDKITDFGKQTQSKFLQPLTNNTNLIVGKKPCARDGHCAVIIDNQLIVFGGDRHQLSFNDIHKLNFDVTTSKHPEH